MVANAVPATEAELLGPSSAADDIEARLPRLSGERANTRGGAQVQ